MHEDLNKISALEMSLAAELTSLKKRRDVLCSQFVRKEIGIPSFCMHLDLIGKKFADNCLFASIYRLGKKNSSINRLVRFNRSTRPHYLNFVNLPPVF